MNGTEGYKEQFAKLSFHAYCWHVISRAVAYRFTAAITSILLSCSCIYILFHASIDACTACLKRFCDSVLKAGQNGIPASGCSLARSDYPQRQHAHAHSHRFLLKPFPASALQPPPLGIKSVRRYLPAPFSQEQPREGRFRPGHGYRSLGQPRRHSPQRRQGISETAAQKRAP